MDLNVTQIVIRLFIAAFLGSVVGFERERHDKAAGLRTHMLVCVGAALTMMVSTYGFRDVLGIQDKTVLDPARIAAQVISGIGFLGAGIIIFRRDVVIGLTTAAGIWAVAAIGLAAGSGLYVEASVATGLVLIVIVLIRPIEIKLRGIGRALALMMTVDCSVPISDIDSALHNANATFKGVEIEHTEEPNSYQVRLMLDPISSDKTVQVLDMLNLGIKIRQWYFGLMDIVKSG